eukprot:CAMPEP_0172655354 /NCGR_PEP_ID=MMETSP1074-20121228/590_1 /TAXON_ID=2916 /ORGANISM="Ceratium fusus, Strain PA161109" /LENGTH=73 /DNA_ID=CAMNT_0013469965 /DNA_START=61 /DNA_END=282 /DNA_ORIENTATION=-
MGSALLLMPTPPDKPLAQDRSAGTLTDSAKHRGQQVPVSLGALYTNGGLHARSLHVMPLQASRVSPFPGEKTG